MNTDINTGINVEMADVMLEFARELAERGHNDVEINTAMFYGMTQVNIQVLDKS